MNLADFRQYFFEDARIVYSNLAPMLPGLARTGVFPVLVSTATRLPCQDQGKGQGLFPFHQEKPDICGYRSEQ